MKIDDDNDSDDDSDDDGINDDEDKPPEKDRTSFPCDWEKVFNFCYTPGFQPFKCTIDGCDEFVHQTCQNAFEQIHGHCETFIPKCCMHHPHSLFNATKPSTSNEENQQPEPPSPLPTRKGRPFGVREGRGFSSSSKNERSTQEFFMQEVFKIFI